MNNQLNQTKMKEFENDIEEFIQEYEKRHIISGRCNVILILSSLLLSVFVTISGLYEWSKPAAILGLIIGLLIALQNKFSLGEKAEFYRIVVTEGQNLKSDLEFGVKNEAEFQVVLEKFKKLRMHTAVSLPKGKAMEAVKDI